MPSISKFVGAKIRTLRDEADMSQADLARALGTTPNTISRWETGTYKPSIDDLSQLSRVLGKSIWAFFPPDLQPLLPPTEQQQALLSATGDLPPEDLIELQHFVDFIRAKKRYKKA